MATLLSNHLQSISNNPLHNPSNNPRVRQDHKTDYKTDHKTHTYNPHATISQSQSQSQSASALSQSQSQSQSQSALSQWLQRAGSGSLKNMVMIELGCGAGLAGLVAAQGGVNR